MLVFPMVPTFVTGSEAAFALHVGRADFGSLARLVLGPAPGAWAVSWFIPASAVLSAMLAAPELRGRAFRMLVVAGGGVLLAWASAAGWLPEGFANPVAYTAAAAVAEVLLIGYGVSLAPVLGRATVVRDRAGRRTRPRNAPRRRHRAPGGNRHDRELGDRRGQAPAGVALGRLQGGGQFRVLWIGRASGSAFPAPGGDPEGVVAPARHRSATA
jgi:hypothetical protein